MNTDLLDLLRRCYDLYQDAHEGECGAALEQGEDECTCGAEELMAQIEQVLAMGDAQPPAPKLVDDVLDAAASELRRYAEEYVAHWEKFPEMADSAKATGWQILQCAHRVLAIKAVK